MSPVSRYDERCYRDIVDVFDQLPLCTTVNDRIFVVHGGLPRFDSGAVDLSELTALGRGLPIILEPESSATDAEREHKCSVVAHPYICSPLHKTWLNSSTRNACSEQRI
eukprot:SAG11_NODE_2524_length_3260_cov_1.524518_5_plen_109_part_00